MIIDEAGYRIMKLIRYIDNVLENGNAILIHSMYGMNRSVLVTSAFLMYKFKWNARKTQDFIKLKKQTVDLRISFFRQLEQFERKLREEGVNLTSGWWHKTKPDVDYDEMVLNNTFLNSRTRQKDKRRVNHWYSDFILMKS